MRPTDGDVSRLPKWAQRRIENLERDGEHWKKRALAGPEDTNVFALLGMEEKPLAPGSHVRFYLDRRPDRDPHRIDAYEQNGKVYVNVGSGRLLFEPQSSNSGWIRAEEF